MSNRQVLGYEKQTICENLQEIIEGEDNLLYNQKKIANFPAEMKILQQCEPEYITLPGWQISTQQIRSYDDLPPNAKNYIETIEKLVGIPVVMISVGPDRQQTIMRDKFDL